MTRRTDLAVFVLLFACGTSAPEAPPAAAAPVPAPTLPAPLPPPARFVPANAELRIPAGEERGVAGTDVVLRVDAPERAPESQTCTAHVALRAGIDVHDEVATCGSAIVFHGLTLVVTGDRSMVGDSLVAITLASNGPDEAPPADCATDADCVLAAYSCCTAPPCDETAYNPDVLAFLQDRCAHRVCPAHEARPCGEPPDPPSTIHASCVAGTCQGVP